MVKNSVFRFLASFMLIASIAGCQATATQRTAGETVDDATLTTRIKSNIIQDQQLSAFQIDVDTYRGVVQLNGFVDSEDSARRAVEIARNVPGVESVKNNLQVKPQAAG